MSVTGGSNNGCFIIMLTFFLGCVSIMVITFIEKGTN